MREDAGTEVEGDVIEVLIARLAAQAHAERRAMVEKANRSMGQYFRHARERIRKVVKG